MKDLTPLTNEQIDEGLRYAEIGCNEFTTHAHRHYEAALRELKGLRKSYALVQKGMESQAELMDGLKQKTRQQAAELERLRRDAPGYCHKLLTRHGVPDALPDGEGFPSLEGRVMMLVESRDVLQAELARLRAVTAAADGLREAVGFGWRAVCDALSIAEHRHATDLATFSPWPELREAEKVLAAALAAYEAAKKGHQC